MCILSVCGQPLSVPSPPHEIHICFWFKEGELTQQLLCLTLQFYFYNYTHALGAVVDEHCPSLEAWRRLWSFVVNTLYVCEVRCGIQELVPRGDAVSLPLKARARKISPRGDIDTTAVPSGC